MAPSSPLPYCPAVWWVGYGASLSACADAVSPDRPSLDAAPRPPPRSHPGQSDYWGRVSFPDKKSAPRSGVRGARRAAGGHRSRHQRRVGRREEPPKPLFPETQPPCSRRDPLGPRSPGLRAMGLPLPRLRPMAGTPRCSQPHCPTARPRCSRLDQPLRRPRLRWAGRRGQFPWAPLDSGMSPSPRAIPGQDDGPETDHSHTGQGQGLRSCLGHWAAPAILTCSLLCTPGQHRLHRKLQGGWGDPRQGTQPLRRGTEAWGGAPWLCRGSPCRGRGPRGPGPRLPRSRAGSACAAQGALSAWSQDGSAQLLDLGL